MVRGPAGAILFANDSTVGKFEVKHCRYFLAPPQCPNVLTFLHCLGSLWTDHRQVDKSVSTEFLGATQNIRLLCKNQCWLHTAKQSTVRHVRHIDTDIKGIFRWQLEYFSAVGWLNFDKPPSKHPDACRSCVLMALCLEQNSSHGFAAHTHSGAHPSRDAGMCHHIHHPGENFSFRVGRWPHKPDSQVEPDATSWLFWAKWPIVGVSTGSPASQDTSQILKIGMGVCSTNKNPEISLFHGSVPSSNLNQDKGKT